MLSLGLGTRSLAGRGAVVIWSMKMAYSQRLQRIILRLFLPLWKLKMDLFFNVKDVADGGMAAVPSSSSKKTAFLLHQWRTFFKPCSCSGVKGASEAALDTRTGAWYTLRRH